ncbi:hypothetical protein [Streptomyces swartbergensis]|uniref:Uncharacterized protein n=1 Tax=Streptomyces swartbergensis TaxID=487165 RepID=A0A243RN33_9ACTN|nr:hypothetical protein [Streptomyces swartbergensis]OUC96330.1 hypothetical protein CA983_32030 [Streptomyces swartbergensis]
MTAQDYDNQLLESVSVRRRRLRDALLFGAQRQRRSLDERVGKAFAGVVIAAVVCAGCVGWSFVSHKVIGNSPYGAPVPSSGQSSPTTAAPSASSSR